MKLWRISNYCDLSGVGAQTVSARWHTAGEEKRVVHLAEHPALALVEILVNLKGNPKQLPSVFQLLKVNAAPETTTEHVDQADLGDGWERDQARTQRIGDAWLAKASSALLRVPAAPSPESWNYLLNPLHLEAGRLHIEWCRWIAYDSRLFGFREKI
jgi:RES domain-containing protein